MIKPMTIEYAKEISGWEYKNEYSIYSFTKNEETIKELLNGDYFACLNIQGELIGYFCFGKPARIEAVEQDVYDPKIMDIGLGMVPYLCGQGFGFSFVKYGLEFAKNRFGAEEIRLTVAAFNTRAIKVYEKVGFKPIKTITHKKTQKKFIVMIYSY